MDLSVFSTAVQNVLGTQLPSILAAIGILIVGYIFALIVRAATRKLLSLARINTLISNSVGKPVDIEGAVSLSLFWLVLLCTLLGVLNTLNLAKLSGPLGEMVSQIMGYLPHLLAGALLLFVAWLAATIVKTISNRALKATEWNDKLAKKAGMSPLSDNVGNVLFWLVFLMFLPAILGAFQLEGMLTPVSNMLDKGLSILPNIFAAAAIMVAGWVVATILRGLTTNLLAAAGADKLGDMAGMKDVITISKLVGGVVFTLILLPTMIASLDSLKITAISAPATDMLSMMMMAIPNIFAATLILVITWYVAQFAAGLMGGLLANLGINSLPATTGMQHLLPEQIVVSELISRIIVFFAMLFATVEAASRLEFSHMSKLVNMFIELGGNILLGITLLLIGIWLANFAHQTITRASKNSAPGLAGIARFAILGLVLAMGLSAMGIADNIVHMAFAFVLGAIAIAIALAFGLGGREAAGKQLEYWLAKLRKDE
jgi:hypothetical protein